MRWRIPKIVVGLVAAVVSLPLAAQFYSNGASPAGIRWQSLKGQNVRVIAPDFAEGEARRVLFMMDSLSGSICYGLGQQLRPLGSPVVLHANNAASNGISIMAPARIEICAIPSAESYATPWLRQLAVHEYRHAAQYAALFDDHARWPYYLLGQQALLAITGTLPFWWLEGDAVDAETQATTFGRALQPSFTMHYRAVGEDILEGPSRDVWFSGSYNHYTPSHYELGYQMATTANTIAGRYVWGEVVDYASRKFLTITPFEWGMRRHLGYSTEELFDTTFTRLRRHWNTLPRRESNAERILLSNPRHHSPYESYKYPLWVGDNFIVAVKSTFDTPTEIVEVDLLWGHERPLFHTGYINTRPAIIGDYIYWTELRQLSSFSQEMGSVMYRASRYGTGKIQRIRQVGNYALYPTDFKGKLAWVRYNLCGTYTIVHPEGEATLPEGVECHGLAATGNLLYYITTSEEGMAIHSLNPATGQSQIVKPASRVTLSNLVASSDNRLYFGSIHSGYDEVHSLDLTTGIEERLTTATYGAFEGCPSPDGKHLVFTDYDAHGYHLATAPQEGVEQVANTPLPNNVVNPEVYRWEMFPNIDTLGYGPEEADKSRATIPAKRFSKVGNALEIHSWAPIYYRPEQIASGNLSNVHLGLTATSQSLLSDALTTLGLYYLPGGALGTTLNFKYLGLAPKFELSASVDSRSAQYYLPKGLMMRGGDYNYSYDHTEGATPPSPTRANYSLYGRIYLPIILSHSYWTSTLTPSVELSHSNLQLYSPTTRSYSSGQTIAAATLQWNSYTRTAYRNLQPRWGVALVGGVGKSFAPFATTSTIGFLARAYTPAFGANDGLTLKVSYQGILGSGPLSYSVDFGWLTPRGLRATIYPDDRVGYSLQYDTPLLYPDRGIEGIVLLKRVRGSLFVEGLSGRLWTQSGARVWRGTTTFGGDLWFDTAWLRLPSQGDLSFRVGCYFDAAELTNPTFSGGFSVNF